jgi:hypothetical protein
MGWHWVVQSAALPASAFRAKTAYKAKVRQPNAKFKGGIPELVIYSTARPARRIDRNIENEGFATANRNKFRETRK